MLLVGTWPEFGVRRRQGRVDTANRPGIKDALFSSIGLGHVAHVSRGVVTQELAFTAVEFANERHQ